MNKLDYIFSNMPSHWNTRPGSNLHTVTKSICNELEGFSIQLGKVDSMIGVDTTPGSELEKRWGNLLNIPRMYNEGDEDYRQRIKLSVIMLYGGAGEAIKYAVSVVDPNHDVNVYDSWDYEKELPIKGPGYAVCEINMREEDTMPTLNIAKAIDKVKSAGVFMYITYNITNSGDSDTSINISHTFEGSIIEYKINRLDGAVLLDGTYDLSGIRQVGTIVI